MSSNKHKYASTKAKNKRKKKAIPLTAKTADRHLLYENSVQAVDAEIDFVDATYTATRGRDAKFLREDFCGTGNTSCEWVRRRRDNYAVGVDLDEDVMDWGRERHVVGLSDSEQERIALIKADVTTVRTPPQDIVLAMNFSYWVFKKRSGLRDYFAMVRDSLGADGMFVLDCYGGYDAFREMKESTKYDDYTYVWDQAAYNPVSGEMLCHIHFKFKDGTRLKKAFTYDWRLWTLPELREILSEAGFSKVTTYWQGWNEDETEANGEFTAVETADADAGWISYVVADR
ncbi:MAG: cyclopropane fatty-acyl-phospholipid synthase-like methyltransferase [Gammaproteobacteria bacterium]|jgi:cyclopropane fatty-acyl-phospholipid synthase-like methyltransferase